MSATQIRIVGWIGVGAVLSFVVAFLLDPTPPGAGASPGQVFVHVAASGGVDRAAAFLFALSAAGLVVLIAGLRQWFTEISSAPHWLGAAMLAGSVVTATMLIATSALWFTLSSQRIDPGGGIGNAVDAAPWPIFSDAVNYGFVFAGFGAAVVVVCGAAIMLATYGPLQILGRIGAVVAILQIPYLLTAFFTSGPLQAGAIVSIIGFAAVGVWVFLVSVTLLWFARLAAAAARP
jgi:hypothetical protein